MKVFSRISFAILLTGTAAPGRAQGVTPHRLFGVGTFAQSAPGAFSDVGVALHGAALIRLDAFLDIAPELELSEAFQFGTEDVCYHGPDADGPCLQRPTSETVLSLGASLRLHPACGSGICPFVTAGGLASRSLAPSRPLESRSFSDPTASVGFRRVRGGTGWSLAGRWRRLSRWPGPQARRSQIGLRLSLIR